jgi:S-adenosylmethionine hydrolase
MIVLFTDFGFAGPYVGQMKGVLAREAPDHAAIDLMHDAPAFDPRASAYLLAAVAEPFPGDAVFLCVVDPGVGGARAPAVAEADGRRFVGPDNGLFEIVLRRARQATLHTIDWRPEKLSASFHGRDLFAPVAARLANGEDVARSAGGTRFPGWPDELAEIVYVDAYGNAMSGLRAAALPGNARIQAGGRRLERARTFSDMPEGRAFWYENSSGLVEIAVNRGSAAALLGLAPGTPFSVDRGSGAA